MIKENISFIGSGVMAEAMISSLLKQGLTNGEKISASGKHAERVQELNQKYGVKPFINNCEAVKEAGVVILSVKPQRLTEVLEDLKDAIPANALVLSIVAGATINKIGSGLNHKAVIRSMPNTPAQIGQGITVWMASNEVSPEQWKVAQQILGAFGLEVNVDDESYLDMATALSGTGPAYIFLFMEALIDAGVHLGFPRRISEQLVLQTIKGSISYYETIQESNETHVASLRNQVTSPGGTTAEAIYFLEKAGFRTAISRAIWAAFQRSLELGREKREHFPGGEV